MKVALSLTVAVVSASGTGKDQFVEMMSRFEAEVMKKGEEAQKCPTNVDHAD